jgi:phosphoserine phosphatase
VHCPAVTAGLRALSGKRVKPQVRIREREQLVLALFDMEGTILPSNVVESYVWSRMADLPWDQWPDELASVFSRIPSYLMADRRDRGEFLRTFFRRYEGATVEGIERSVEEIVSEFMLQKVSAAAVRRIRDHRAAGHRTMMITAAAEPFVQPLAPLFDEVIAARLEIRDGVVHGLPGRTAPGGRGARGLGSAGTPSSRAPTYGPRTRTPTRIRISRCCGRSATRWRSRRTRRCCAWPSAAVADRGVGHGRGDAPGSVPEAGGALR